MRAAGSSIATHARGSGDGFAARQCDEQAANSASSSWKWRYTVERRTPARSAIALIDVRAGPTSSCSPTALSVILQRASLLVLRTTLHPVGTFLIGHVCPTILTDGVDVHYISRVTTVQRKESKR